MCIITFRQEITSISVCHYGDTIFILDLQELTTLVLRFCQRGVLVSKGLEKTHRQIFLFSAFPPSHRASYPCCEKFDQMLNFSCAFLNQDSGLELQQQCFLENSIRGSGSPKNSSQPAKRPKQQRQSSSQVRIPQIPSPELLFSKLRLKVKFKLIFQQQFMKSLLFAALLILQLHAQACTFEDYIVRYNRTYSSEEERTARLEIFNQRMEQIEKSNSEGHSYVLGCTKWTDRFTSEMQETLFENSLSAASNLKTQAGTQDDQLGSQDSNLQATADHVDWRQKNGVSGVRDQGSCGSCWAFATAASVESLFLIRSNQSYDFSEQYLLQCSGSNSCKGGTFELAWDAVESADGLPLESQYPYRGKDNKEGICGKGTFATIKDLKVSSGSSMSDTAMMTQLSILPVSVGIIADSNFIQYKSGVFKCQYTYTTSMINHALQVIGYNKTGNYYILKNSWGTDWGMNGYAYVDMTSDCLLKKMVYWSDGKAGPYIQDKSYGAIELVSISLLILTLLGLIW